MNNNGVIWEKKQAKPQWITMKTWLNMVKIDHKRWKTIKTMKRWENNENNEGKMKNNDEPGIASIFLNYLSSYKAGKFSSKQNSS